MSLGCRGRPESAVPRTILPAEELGRLARHVTVCIQISDGNVIGCGTIVQQMPSLMLVATASSLLERADLQLIQWLEDDTGQRFQKVELPKFKAIGSSEQYGVTLLAVPFQSNVQVLPLGNDAIESSGSGFNAGCTFPSSPRPLEAVMLKVKDKKSFRHSPTSPSAPFWRIEKEIHFKMLGSPLVADSGDLMGVMVGHSWNEAMCCDAEILAELIREAKVESEPASGAAGG